MVAALYRRYRPENFAEMIGQSQVTDPLMTALRTGRIGHAYLFSGPRGCGKTTSARILARCLNCAQGPTDTPCGTCPSCVELSRGGGGSLDVVEIDAASHGGVDDARDLRERAVFAPARDRYKIFIIDEAHMVTAGGFNALLKIVEEPPPHVKFIFATTEPEKVIGTIRSRTHHYPFRLIAPGTLVDYVQQLCDSEGVQVESGVLPLVVRSGGGSVRDTLSILDQLIAGSEGNLVLAERAAGLLGFTSAEVLDDVVTALGQRDARAAFYAVDRVVQTGQDPRRFVEDLLERLRDLIVVNATNIDGATAVFRGVPQDQLARMFEQARVFGAAELSALADTVAAALDQMSGVTTPKLQLELMIARALVGMGAHDAGASAAPAVPATATPAAPVQQRQAAAPAAQVPAAQQRPVSHTPAPAQPVAQQQQSAPAQAPQQPAAVPNAAQTAASIREFLRESDKPAQAPAAPVQQAPVAQPVAQQQPPIQQQRVAPTQPAQAPAQPQAPVQPQAAPAPQQRQQQAPAAQAPAGQRTQPHPNEGAAKFGRPISDVLSAAQIESIGTEPIKPPQPKPEVQPQAAAPAQPQQLQQQPQAPQQPMQHQAPPAAAPAPAAPMADAEGAEFEETGEPDISDLQEVWSDLLEEILELNRDAWNAVRPVQPLSLTGDVLELGVASRSDLAAFKSAGAGPLREAIFEAVGIRVKYKPTQLQPQATVREAAAPAAPAEPAGSAPEEPHRAGSAPKSDPTADRISARLNALGPALAAPAWADPQPPAPKPGSIAPLTPAAPIAPAAPAAPVQAESPIPAQDQPVVAQQAPIEPPAPVEVPAVAPQPVVTEPVVAEAPAPVVAPEPVVEPEPVIEAVAAEVVAEPVLEPQPEETVAPAPVEPVVEPEPEPAVVEPVVEQSAAPATPAAPAAPRDPADDYEPYFPDEDEDPYSDPYAGMSSQVPENDPETDRQLAVGPTESTQASQAADTAIAARLAAFAAHSQPKAPATDTSAATAAAAPVSAAPAEPAASAPAQADPPTTHAESAATAPAGSVTTDAPAEAPRSKSAPSFTRYGEAVVREVLGAIFLEERELPNRAER